MSGQVHRVCRYHIAASCTVVNPADPTCVYVPALVSSCLCAAGVSVHVHCAWRYNNSCRVYNILEPSQLVCKWLPLHLLLAAACVPQVCQYRCIVSYETPQFEQFALCILQLHNCRGLNAEIPMRPDPAPMTEWRGQSLTHETAGGLMLCLAAISRCCWRCCCWCCCALLLVVAAAGAVTWARPIVVTLCRNQQH